MMSKFLIIFDLDGVIADALSHHVAGATEACRRLGHSSIPSQKDWRELEDVTWEGLGRVLAIPEDELQIFKETAFSVLAKDATEVPIFPEMSRIIKELSRTHTLSIVSANFSAIIDIFLSKHGLYSYFGLIAGADTAGLKSEKMRTVVNRLGTDLRLTYMVGDTTSDIREAQKAGVTIIATTWGFHTREFLAKEQPDYLVDSPEELLGLFHNELLAV